VPKKANVNNNNKAAGPGPEVITSALVSNMNLLESLAENAWI